jgi:hypothetical protein
MWSMTHPNLPTRLTATARKKLILQAEPVSTEQLYKPAGDIMDLNRELDSMCDKAFNSWRQRPNKK